MTTETTAQNKKAKILFQLSGSIACYKACQVISRLVQRGAEVQVVATAAALEFVGQATLEGLTGRRVLSEVFEPGGYMQHIHLMKWADVIVLCPATANTLNKLASGIGDDLLNTLFLAHDFNKPYLLAPAMNTRMYHHPTTQASLHKLKSWGVEILDTASGVLACGDVGDGRLLEPELIQAAIEARLPANSLASASDSVSASSPTSAQMVPLNILITSGGTKEAVDAVRSITNTSTGATGAVLAEYFASQGHHVTYVHAQSAVLPSLVGSLVGSLAASLEPQSRVKGPLAIEPHAFTSYADLDEKLRALLAQRRFAAVIHLAAVSDYSVDSIEVNGKRSGASATQKIDSGETLTIHLRKNPKILTSLKDYAKSPAMLVIGFKLTHEASAAAREQAVTRLAKATDLIVHNDATEIGRNTHHTTLFQGGRQIAECHTKIELAARLEEFISSEVARRNGSKETVS